LQRADCSDDSHRSSFASAPGAGIHGERGASASDDPGVERALGRGLWRWRTRRLRSGAHADIEVHDEDGWTLRTTGLVAARYQLTIGDADSLSTHGVLDLRRNR